MAPAEGAPAEGAPAEVAPAEVTPAEGDTAEQVETKKDEDGGEVADDANKEKEEGES